MVVIKLNIKSNEKAEIDKIWRVTKDCLRREVMHRIGWNKVEDFLADILRYGLTKASDDPVTFIKMVREEKDPVFVERQKIEKRKKFEEEFKKAYA
jgi:hypothetical protein